MYVSGRNGPDAKIKKGKLMNIKELLEQEYGEFTIVEYHEGSCRGSMDAITEHDVCDGDEVRDYWFEPCGDGDTKLHVLVQPEKIIRYIHVGAPAPQYAINSISRLFSAVSYAAQIVGVLAREEGKDVILEPETSEDQVMEVFTRAAVYMEDEGYTGVDAGRYSMHYDAATATSEVTELTRNW